MRYQMKQKILSWGDDFVIRNEAGQDSYVVEGAVFSFGDKLSFQDTNGNELAAINQKLLSWGPTYEIYRGGQLAAIVTKELFTFFKCRFTVDVPGPDDIEAEGDFLDQEYTFSRGGRSIAQVSKQWFSWSDTYGIEIADGEDDVLILTSAIVIDMVCHDNKS
jgi:uncharacterized protein YxjI